MYLGKYVITKYDMHKTKVASVFYSYAHVHSWYAPNGFTAFIMVLFWHRLGRHVYRIVWHVCAVSALLPWAPFISMDELQSKYGKVNPCEYKESHMGHAMPWIYYVIYT